jgi:D-lactate dehydrogenase (cytochrome)
MIIRDKKEDLFNYLEDTSNIKGKASLLYLPQTKEEVSGCLEDCRAKDIPFTVSGGRTGTTGGCVPFEGAIISLEKLNRIIAVNPEKKTIQLETGVTLEDLEKEANKFNLTLPASPTEPLAFVGGAISTSASGVRGFRYGSIRKYIAAIEILLTSGESIKIERGRIISKKRYFDFENSHKSFKFNLPSYGMPAVKSQAGYYAHSDMDLIDLFIGSEGTLGIITSCEVILKSTPFKIFDGLAFFKNENDAFRMIHQIKELKDRNLLNPTALEFFDRNSLARLKKEYPFVPSSALGVYFEQEIDNEGDYNQFIEKWASLIEENAGLVDKTVFADTSKERAKIFEFRHRLPQLINEFLREHKQPKAATDIAVPWQFFGQMYTFYEKIGKNCGIDYVNFGHIGESHLHFNFLPKNEDESLKAKTYLNLFCQKAVALGGTVSAEHGIGKIKKPYLKIMYSENEIKEMAALKKYFDPQRLLGLDNIFEKELLF